MVYNANDSLIVIFNAIEDLLQLATASNLENLQKQIISYGIELLKNNGEFDTSLTTWINCPPADMTWATFENQFLEAHTNLLKIRGERMQNTPYHQASQAI